MKGYRPQYIRKTLLKTLNPQEIDIIRARFGIDCERQTLEQIGKSVGLGKERVRQIQNTALKKLKVQIQIEDKLEDLIGTSY